MQQIHMAHSNISSIFAFKLFRFLVRASCRASETTVRLLTRVPPIIKASPDIIYTPNHIDTRITSPPRLCGSIGGGGGDVVVASDRVSFVSIVNIWRMRANCPLNIDNCTDRRPLLTQCRRLRNSYERCDHAVAPTALRHCVLPVSYGETLVEILRLHGRDRGFFSRIMAPKKTIFSQFHHPTDIGWPSPLACARCQTSDFLSSSRSLSDRSANATWSHLK